jgi:Aerobic-type carbon monoxide dehydrogenase, large subunit CoxL/CutL homologs
MRVKELLPLLKGEGKYVDDLPFQGKWAAFVRSPYPHARIKSIDTSDATSRGGFVLTGKQVRSGQISAQEREGSSVVEVLSTSKVRYVGDPVAVVLADDPYKAKDLADLVVVDYEPLRPINDVDEALKNDSLIFEELGTNLVGGNTVEMGFKPQDQQLELELYWSRSAGNPIESYGAFVVPEGGSFRIYSNAQAPGILGKEVERALGVSVKMEPIRAGGSFGTKFSIQKYLMALVAASKTFNFPVKWTETRTEHFQASNSSGPERRFKVRTFFRKTGQVTGVEMRVDEDVGAARSGGQAFKPLGILTGPYEIPYFKYEVRLIATNKNPPGAFRGAGTPPHTWALERTMDALADELGMDRVEIRRKNLIRHFPYETQLFRYDSGDPLGLLELAEAEAKKLREKGYVVGVACSTDPSTPSGSEGLRLRVRGGKVIVQVGYSPEGQGNEHALRLLVSKFLELDPSNLEVELEEGVPSFGPGGSRMAVFGAGAAKGAAEELVSKARKVVGSQATYSKGKLVTTNGETSLLEMEGLEAEYVFTLDNPRRFNAYPFCCNVSAARIVDGEVKVERQIVFIDPGAVIDQELVRDQVTGGTANGIGLALTEGLFYSEGNPTNATLHDYGMPRAVDLPSIEVRIVPTPSPYTPSGAKGIGEIPVGVAAAAATSAVEQALGIKVRRVPILRGQ